MSLWKELTTEQLYKILECKNFEKIHKRLVKFINDGIEYDLHRAMKKIRAKYKDALSNYEIMQSVFSVLTSEAAYPIIILLAIAQATMLSIMTLSILTAGTALLALGVGIYFFVNSYKEYKIKRANVESDFAFIQIKLECAKEIITRQQAPCAPIVNQEMVEVKPFIKPFVYKNENRFRRVSNAIVATLLTAGSLIGVYYLTVAVSIAAFGATAALLGPIGIGVAVGVALLIGIYAGYKQYQALYNNEKRAVYQEHLVEQLHKKCDLCDRLRGVPKHKPLYTYQQNTESSVSQATQTIAYFESTSAIQRRNFMNKKPSSPQTIAQASNHPSPK